LEWSGDLEAFVAWCKDAMDLGQLGAALATVPGDLWPGVAERLEAELAAGDSEPTRDQLNRATGLADRMTGPAAILRRQIRLEKLRLVQERAAGF
jgi:hypothetical protein